MLRWGIEREVEKHAGPSVGVGRGRGKREENLSLYRDRQPLFSSSFSFYFPSGLCVCVCVYGGGMGAPMVLLLICIMISCVREYLSLCIKLTAMLFDCYAETSERAMHDASIGHFRPDGLASSTDDRHLYLGSSTRFAATHHVSHRLGQQVQCHPFFFFFFFLLFYRFSLWKNQSRDIDETVWGSFTKTTKENSGTFRVTS